MTQHPDWDALNAFADGTTRNDVVRVHVADCEECQRTIGAIAQLAHDAHALATDTRTSVATVTQTPDTDALWRDIAASIAPAARRRRAPRVPWRVLATAAGIAILSSGTTWWVMRTPTAASNPAASVLPVSFQRTEATYLDNVSQLRGDLERLRAQLDPRTVAAVERSLDVIDAAIAEARAALLADPANAAVSDLLASHYRQKIDLLRRATQLTPAV